ncbi:MAG: hypothetical protein GXP42_14585 [Chloroflexi bacterium]|nr:hypothetical protein [Chloroflexota bacterium]
MSVQTMTIQLPSELYEYLERRAKNSRRSVNEEVVEAIAIAAQERAQLSPEMESVLDQLNYMDDATLWRMARSRLSEEEARRLEELNWKQQREGLTMEEEEERDMLLWQYDRRLLVRAKAMALLKERGHDISELLAPV